MGVLDDTAVLVTGASSGIGEAAALALAGHGSKVAIAARRGDRLAEVAGRISGFSKVCVIEADLTKESECRRAVEETVEAFGRLDILVNNAGVMLLGPISGAPTGEWKRMIEINLLGLMYCTHAALPHLLHAAESEPRRVADIINISSVAGRIARLNNGVYAATKVGVVAFGESLRQEVTRRHVRVTAIEPGATATELPFQNRPEILEDMAKTFDGIETMQAVDIANAIAYAVTQPRHVVLNEVLIRPTEQER
jgi:NADP-dependent 3-hydroxy acid dehydrogenase YdfG